MEKTREQKIKEWHDLVGKEEFEALDKKSQEFLINTAEIFEFSGKGNIKEGTMYKRPSHEVEEMTRERRYKFVMVSPEVLAQFFKEGEIHLKVVRGLPRDVEFVQLFYDSFDYTLKFMFYHPDWEDVPLGEKVPEFGKVVFKDIRGETK
ncbi:MAG: hypothetical protein JRI41_06855 [Deltaproteobacteria bacterium]|nr:hypothetical protein [Deltaproteobacteria bacterium]